MLRFEYLAVKPGVTIDATITAKNRSQAAIRILAEIGYGYKITIGDIVA